MYPTNTVFHQLTKVLLTAAATAACRGFTTQQADPVLFSSTYDVGDMMIDRPEFESLSDRKRVVKGYKAQCEPVISHLERLLSIRIARNESAIVEGVHLSLKMVVQLMLQYPCIVPFLVRTVQPVFFPLPADISVSHPEK